jgi:Endomembrane protein 70
MMMRVSYLVLLHSLTRAPRTQSHFLPSALEIHWLSIFNSLVLVVLLTAFLAIILMRVVRNDFTRYMRPDDDEVRVRAGRLWHACGVVCMCVRAYIAFVWARKFALLCIRYRVALHYHALRVCVCGQAGDMGGDDSGWKLIHGDAFRAPMFVPACVSRGCIYIVVMLSFACARFLGAV